MSPAVRRLAGVSWLPALLAVLAVVEMLSLRPSHWGSGVALEVLACLLMVLRSRLPLAAPLAAMALLVLIPVLGTPLDQPATPIAIWALSCYSLGRYADGRRTLVAVGLVLVGVFVDYRWFDDRVHNISDVVFVLVLAAPPYVLGRLMRRLSDQKSELVRTHELLKQAAVRDERDRIARDLHDVIAHSVSAMVVQTAAAQDLLRTDPDRAEQILAGVADTGRRSLAETGRLLHVIRDSNDELGLAPARGLAQVPELVDRFRADGLRVDLDLVDPVPVLPSGLDVSAYRIVQEALTNALRYGADRRASLAVSCSGDRLSIRSSNPSNGATGWGSGLGLLGLAERVAVLGGTLSHGVTAEGRFELDATLPVGS